jgi:hypothetical protein
VRPAEFLWGAQHPFARIAITQQSTRFISSLLSLNIDQRIIRSEAISGFVFAKTYKQEIDE